VSGQRDIGLPVVEVNGTLVTQNKVLTDAEKAAARVARCRHRVRHHQRPVARENTRSMSKPEYPRDR
jgi:hypothetical protein